MILTGPTIRRLAILEPHVSRSLAHGMSYGESYAGYDIRLRDRMIVWPIFARLGVSIEHFAMPDDVIGRVHDKSTLARRGVQVQNTIIEPGWRGYLTIEVTYTPLRWWKLWHVLPAGTPIAQVIFDRIDAPTAGYSGKYQDQPARPVAAAMEQPTGQKVAIVLERK